MILFVDEEPTYTKSHRQELELENYKIVLKQKVDDAWAFLKERSAEVELLILDVMMPPSKLTGIEEDGMRTGILFFERVRREFPELPVMVFTNKSDKDTKEYFKDKSHCWFLRKSDPFQLVEKVRKILGSAASTKGV